MITRRSGAVFALMILSLALTSCMTLQDRVARMLEDDDPYAEEPFYYKYLFPEDSELDAEIMKTLDAVRADRESAVLHNQLGSLLVEKGFPKDAEKEFRRALWADERFFPASYNMALARKARGNESGAVRALRQTLEMKPGHAAAHFQLALILEKRGRTAEALDHYVDAFRINPALLDVRVNPLVLDTELVDLALIELYPHEHTVRSLQFEKPPKGYQRPMEEIEHDAPSEVEEPEEIVTPAPPVTETAPEKRPE